MIPTRERFNRYTPLFLFFSAIERVLWLVLHVFFPLALVAMAIYSIQCWAAALASHFESTMPNRLDAKRLMSDPTDSGGSG